MNQDQIVGKYQQMREPIKRVWGRLTDEEIALYSRKFDAFCGKVEEKYGLTEEEVFEKLHELANRVRPH